MRELIWLHSAIEDIVRLREFIAANNPNAAKKAAETLKQAAVMLTSTPNIGKPVSDLPDYRDFLIRFGVAGYVMRYRIYLDKIYVVHIRHYRESGFKSA